MNRFEAIQIAEVYATSKGFALESGSNLSEAIYLRADGYLGNLRVAAHKTTHGFGVVAALVFTDPTDRFPYAFAYDAGTMSRAAVEEATQETMDEYLSKAEEEEDE